nr:uncharacterized protein LOC126525109 isoform X2 [Dermacentor andersoni]
MDIITITAAFLIVAINTSARPKRTSWTWSVAKGIGRDEVPFNESCSRFDEGQKKVRNEADGTTCKKGNSHGSCFLGQCVGAFAFMNNIYQDDASNGDLCSEYKVKTTRDGAVMDCSYWCIEGRNEYSVDLLDRTFCAGSDTDRGLCMEGSCNTSQPLSMALMHRYRETKPGERARGSTTQKISTKQGVSVGSNASTVQFIEPNIRSSEIGYPDYSGRSTPQYGNFGTSTGVLSTVATESAMTVEHSHSALPLTMTPAVSKSTTYKNLAAERTFYVEHYMPTQSEYTVPATTLDMTSVVGQEASYRGKEKRTESTTRVVGIEEVNIPDVP